MKKIICLFVVVAFVTGVRADNKKKNSGGGHAAASIPHMGGSRPAGGGMHMPGSAGGQHHASQPGNHMGAMHNGSGHAGMSGNNPMSHHSGAGSHNSEGATHGVSSSNPLSRHGGQAKGGTNNPLAQKGHANGSKGNPMTQHGTKAAHSNPMSRNGVQGNRNFAAQHGIRSNGYKGGHAFAHAAHANYHVRPYHEVFHNYHAVYHDRYWYGAHYDRVVVVGGGYYYWDAGYWYPAWGYDPGFSAYVYDGPIYSYDNLPPDEVVTNVQTELQDEGYYTGEVDGQLGPQTRDAIGAYQADHDLEVTSAVDEPTVESLGLVEST